MQYDAQMYAFIKQMELATELGRPVSLHCVHAQGDLFDYCRAAEALPPAIYLHSFGGKVSCLSPKSALICFRHASLCSVRARDRSKPCGTADALLSLMHFNSCRGNVRCSCFMCVVMALLKISLIA